MEDHQEHQRRQGHVGTDSQADAHDESVAQKVAQDRQHAEEKGQTDNDSDKGIVVPDEEPGGEGGVDRRDEHLGSHHLRETIVKPPETFCDLAPDGRIQVIVSGLGFSPEIELETQEETNGDHETDEQRHCLNRQNSSILPQVGQLGLHHV